MVRRNKVNIFSVSVSRKRFNPLYDTMINTSPTIYNKVNTTVKAKQDHTVLTQLRLMKLAILLLILISIASLFISVYVVIAFSDGKSSLSHQSSMIELS